MYFAYRFHCQRFEFEHAILYSPINGTDACIICPATLLVAVPFGLNDASVHVPNHASLAGDGFAVQAVQFWPVCQASGGE